MKLSLQDNIKMYRKIQEMTSPNTINKKYYEDQNILGVKVRIFNKMAQKVLIYIHGGGWVAGSLNTHSNICFHLAKELDRKVVSIDYSLAPENKFPVAIYEIQKVARELFKSYNNMDIMGDSAGANLAFAVATSAKDLKFNKIIMVYPATQTDYTIKTKYKSVITNSGKSMLAKESLRDYLKMYLRSDRDYKDKRVNLLRNYWLFGLPEVLIVTGSLDPLHDEGVALKDKLQRYFVKTKHLDLDGATHGFLTNPLDHKYTLATLNFIKECERNE